MENEFQIGDTVKIVNLESHDGTRWAGKIGHVGKIIKTDKGEDYYEDIVFYELYPHCSGTCWPADCLEMVKPAKRVKPKKIKGTLFNIDDI